MSLKIACLIFLITGTCLSQNVKINELMYAPKNGEPEWVELFNGSSDSVNVKNWAIRNKNAHFYVLTASNFFVKPDSYLVLTKSDTIFSFHRTIPSRVLICSALPVSFMVNTGDTISIHDSTGALVDSVFYEPSWGGSDGKSLERISTESSPFLSTDWGSSLDSSGSTPGRKNSIAAEDYDLKIAAFSAFISPSDSSATFRVTVKNCGLHPTSPFSVQVFLDYDNDFVIQPDELAGETDNVLGLRAGDTVQIVLKAAPQNLHALNAMAVVEFSSDQDTTNNYMWTQIRFSYREKCLVVNEIMYAPKKPESEWVEFYNTSSNLINLKGFSLADDSGTKAVIANADYLFSPNDYVVVAHDTGFFSAHPGVHDNVLITKTPSLNDNGDAVVIHDAMGNLIDSVYYSPSWGGNKGGKSLERVLFSSDSNDPESWGTSTDSSGSTPTKINSVTPRDFDLAVGTVSYLPNSVQSGTSVKIFASILNCGLKPPGSAAVIFFVDKDGNGICNAGEPIDSTQISQIVPGDSTTVSFNAVKLSFGLYHFGIFINYRDDEFPFNNTKVFSINVGLPIASVVINEIMYAPRSPEQEWFELYNTTDAVIDLSNFKIETHGGSCKINVGSMIAPGDFAVICKDSSVSLLHYPVKNLIIQSTPSQSNSGDWIALYDNFGNILDSINYVPSYGGSSGKSLERLDYFSEGDSTNWHESVDSTGATPGMVNSIATLPYDVSLKSLDCPGSLNVNQQLSLNLVVRNVGRNSVSDIEASIEILNGIDGKTVFSGKQTMNSILAPGDSADESFAFTPPQPGTYRILGSISQRQDQRKWNDTLSTWANISYQSQSVVVNEIMYSAGKTGEYFEIYNTSQYPIDISNWTFHTSSQPKPAKLSAIQKIISPNNYFVIAADSLIFNFISDTNLVQIVKSMSLRDDGGCIVLLDPSGVVIDSVYYLPSWHSSDVANTSGRSLEKINPALPSNEKTSWSTSVSPVGGTPGKRNSLFVDAGNAGGSISVSPNPFSPDGDGVDDFTFISYTFPVSSVKVEIRIFDSIGRLIATPVDNSILPSTGKIVWDGRDNSGKIVKFGLYILLVEVAGPNGNSLSVYKKPLIVAKKMK